jgi:DNA mismatch endonuclease (patch repair protein)
MDRLDPSVRSALMARIRGQDTAPEVAVRRALHRAGLRFRLHRKDLPGSPDVVLPRWRLCIFVHGCFWHRHAGCRRATTPTTNVAFWQEKFARNVRRDRRVRRRLRALGWRTAVVWECEAAKAERLVRSLERIFGRLKPPTDASGPRSFAPLPTSGHQLPAHAASRRRARDRTRSLGVQDVLDACARTAEDRCPANSR